jgi:nicotinamidase-related amidase
MSADRQPGSRSAASWDHYLSPRDRDVLAASGFGARMGFGARPALLIVDVNYNFCGDAPTPILDAIRKRRTACGDDAWAAVGRIATLLAACRARNLPVLYSTNQRRPDGFDAGSWRWKNSRSLENSAADIEGNAIVAEIAPSPCDVVVVKTKPSAFFGTPLLSFLVDLKVDSLLVCGGTTSGCVRATVIDAFSNNLRCAVVAEACFDRIEASHAMSLFDMHAKYADVVSLDEAKAFVGSLRDDLFELPGGRSR